MLILRSEGVGIDRRWGPKPAIGFYLFYYKSRSDQFGQVELAVFDPRGK
jgi:hypothetical protein